MAMIDVFIPLKGFLKIEKLRTDNVIFRLHYRLTVILLVISMLLVTSKQLFGDSIHCFGNGGKEVIYKEAMNNFCWMYGTYLVNSHMFGVVGKEVAYPGVGPDSEPADEVPVTYYQWVFVVLMLQAFMFYVPHYLWKIWENGRIRALTNNLDGPSVPAEWAQSRKAELVSYLTHSKMFAHNVYALRFAACECLNLANVVLQMFLMDRFLGGRFLSYGADVVRGTDAMTRCFPKLGKCRFLYYGPSGQVQTSDVLCVLPINVVNEKIYVVLWFWFAVLALLSAGKVAHTLAALACPRLRALLLRGQLRSLRRAQAERIAARGSFGDWFVLRQLGENLNPVVYRDLLLELAAHV